MGSVIPEKHGVMKSNQWSASTKPLLMNFDESLACTLAREAPITKRESIRQRLMLRVFLNSCSLLFEFGYLYHCAPPRRSRSKYSGKTSSGFFPQRREQYEEPWTRLVGFATQNAILVRKSPYSRVLVRACAIPAEKKHIWALCTVEPSRYSKSPHEQ